MSQSHPVTIVVACDNHYCIMLAALLKSIETHYDGASPMDVYIVDDHISVANKQRLIASLHPKPIVIHWIPIAEAVPDNVSLPVVPNSYPLNTYIRLLIPYFIPEGIKKVLFMDVDMIVLADITKLFNIDIGNYPIGAVQDSITKTIGNIAAGGPPNYKELGLNEASPYFNAGLQLINIPRWREEKLTERILECIHHNAKYAMLGDQYGLNVVLADNWFPLNPHWNYMANGDAAHPCLIHFIHRKPFYKSYFNNPNYQRMFYEYLSHTAWRDDKPIGEPARYVKKFKNVLQKARQLF